MTVRHKAEAQAAIMLLESLLLTLIERSVLTKSEVLDCVEIVIDTKRHMADAQPLNEVETAATGLLINVANSLGACSSSGVQDGGD